MGDIEETAFSELFSEPVYDYNYVEKIVTGPSIRLEKASYDSKIWRLLIESIVDRLPSKARGYARIDAHRRIVAEEMVRLSIVIKYTFVKPNRRFLDIMMEVPKGLDIGGKELERRLRSLLYQAIRSRNETRITDARENLKTFIHRKTFRHTDDVEWK